MIEIAKTKWIIPLLTIMAGFVTFSIIALCTDSFWTNSACDVPVLKTPSLYIGDTIFIPLFNYFLYCLYKSIQVDSYYQKYKNIFPIYFGISLLISFIISYRQHITWTKDQFTGFIDLEYNKLSIGGYYHLFFASIEIAIILIFFWLLFIVVKEHDYKKYLSVKSIIWVFFFYSCCAVLDLLVKIYYIADESYLSKGLKEYLSELGVFYFGIMLVVAYYLIKAKYLMRI